MSGARVDCTRCLRQKNAVARIAQAMETALVVALSERGDFSGFNPVEEARVLAGHLRQDLKVGPA